jgi:hypothetical protein
VLIIDSGSNAVADAKDDAEVKVLFNYLHRLMREAGVLAVVVVLHLRKRAQGMTGRKFDDLFGSREWKGRASAVLHLEDRGGGPQFPGRNPARRDSAGQVHGGATRGVVLPLTGRPRDAWRGLDKGTQTAGVGLAPENDR